MGRRADYGIDAPGVRRGMLAAGFVGLGLAFAPGWISWFGAVVGTYGVFMGLYMTYGSRVGKVRARERLLDLAGAVRPWTGDEAVLDVGCGRGLMVVGAARRLTTGTAVGIDVWRAGSAESAILGVLSGGSYSPRALIGVRGLGCGDWGAGIGLRA